MGENAKARWRMIFIVAATMSVGFVGIYAEKWIVATTVPYLLAIATPQQIPIVLKVLAVTPGMLTLVLSAKVSVWIWPVDGR